VRTEFRKQGVDAIMSRNRRDLDAVSKLYIYIYIYVAYICMCLPGSLLGKPRSTLVCLSHEQRMRAELWHAIKHVMGPVAQSV